MLDIGNILSIIMAFFIVTVSPGPANLAIATVAMSSGRRKGFFFGMGLSVGLAFWGLIAATGMGALLQGSAHFLFALKILGGLYLLWLAFQSYLATQKQTEEIDKVPSSENWFIRGLLLNLSNPKAIVAWMAALSMGLGVGDNSGHVIMATLICMVLGFLNYTAYAFAFSLPGFMAGYKLMRRWIEGIAAGLFALAGIGLLKSAFTR